MELWHDEEELGVVDELHVFLEARAKFNENKNIDEVMPELLQATNIWLKRHKNTIKRTCPHMASEYWKNLNLKVCEELERKQEEYINYMPYDENRNNLVLSIAYLKGLKEECKDQCLKNGV